MVNKAIKVIEERLVRYLFESREDKQPLAIHALGWLRSPTAVDALAEFVLSPITKSRRAALKALRRYRHLPEAVVDKLRQAEVMDREQSNLQVLVLNDYRACSDKSYIGGFFSLNFGYEEGHPANDFRGYIAGTNIAVQVKDDIDKQTDACFEEWYGRPAPYPSQIQLTGQGIEVYFRAHCVSSATKLFSFGVNHALQMELPPWTVFVTQPNVPVRYFSAVVDVQWKSWDDSPDLLAKFADDTIDYYTDIDIFTLQPTSQTIPPASVVISTIEKGDPRAKQFSPGVGDILPFDHDQQGNLVQGFVRLRESLGNNRYDAAFLVVNRGTLPKAGDVLTRTCQAAFPNRSKGMRVMQYHALRSGGIQIVTVIGNDTDAGKLLI